MSDKATPLNELGQTLEAALLEKVQISDKNLVTIEGGEALWEEHCPIALEDVDKLSDYRGTFSSAFTSAVGKKLIERVKENEDIARLDYTLSTRDCEFGMEFARPEPAGDEALTREAVRDCIGSRVGFRGLDSTEQVADTLADLWDF